MAWTLTAAETAFRDEVRDFLARELTPDLRRAGRRCAGIFSDYDEANRWHRILATRGWSVPHWPVEHGGTGWTPMQHYIFSSELAAADAPQRAPMGPGMVAPVIIAFGTGAQKRRWLPGIASGEDYWCQGYSEPQAGSDLASLQCKAVRDGAHYVINGSKIWTTHAQYANRMFCLVRTASGGKPQQGISFLCFDLPAQGVTIRPIVSISGDHEFNEVFFDDVRVPADGLIGEENQGWTIAKYLLQHERGGAWAPMLRARLRRLTAAAGVAFASPGHEDEADGMALRLAEMDCAIDAVEATELQSLRAQARGEPVGIRPSMGKVLGSELRQRLTELGVEIAGHHAAANLPLDDGLQGDMPIPEEAVFSVSAYLNDRAASIYAGSNEVQRNIVASHLLAR
ncbi:acyl-CoA dehydrogenase family protein [Variovorax sp. E3]|uniref:acyl-CoA dehydrogenase family protein n=1 Tax=Variovorax sp. E3 TaxID=1914993 RepID=UPI0018DDB25D|nr:acyl-CoA dehydrogenase family protein [Variovorax sp. E3]